MDKKEKESKDVLSPEARTILSYKAEALAAKQKRMNTNRDNFEAYHLEQNFSHKTKGQSQEFLPKQQMAVEQITSFLQQGLMDFGDWFNVERLPGVVDDGQKITEQEIKKLLARQLDKNDFAAYVADSMKMGLLGSLMITKLGGRYAPHCKYTTEIRPTQNGAKKKLLKKEKKIWELDLSLVRQQDYYPDPTGEGLFEVQEIEMDYHTLVQIAEQNPEDFDMKMVRESCEQSNSWNQDQDKSRETGQNSTKAQSIRKRVTILECWGTIIDPTSGEILHENVVCATTDSGQVIRPPKKNPWWHGKSPFIVSPIIRVPKSVWHRALMDAGTKLNRALNELFNLELDAGLMSVWGIRQLREDYLEDPTQVNDGIPPGTTLLVNSQCPPNTKVLERIDTGTLSQEALNMFQATDREGQAAMLTNDTRLGNLPQRAVKATEIVQSNQSITGVFNGIVKIIEQNYIAKILDLGWQAMAQNMDDLDLEEVKALFGDDRAMYLSQLSPEDRFAQTAQGHKFKVFGLSTTLNKIQDFRKITSLLQTIGTNQALIDAFNKKYSFTKLLGEILKSLDIDTAKIQLDEQEKAEIEKQKAMMQEMLAKEAAKEQGKNQQSQIPQMNAGSTESGATPPNNANDSGMTEFS